MTECTHCRKRYDDSVRFCPVDGFAVAPVAEPFIGRLLMGQFQIQSVCGHGATGTVYQAVQAGMERAVAVKVLRADLLKDPDVVRRFVREARAGAKLNHQNIATVHLVGQTDEGVPFIVMEYVEGLALASILAVGKPLPLGRIVHLGAQIASALSEAHCQGIVHRDLKPENILLTERRGETDVVKVVDFGIAKMIAHAAPGEDPISRMGTVFGTPHYIAPEQASGQAVDGRADIYSLGCILYQMATGHVPFEGQTGLQVLLSQVRDKVPDPRMLNPRLGAPLAELILRMLEKSPTDRPPTAEFVGQALAELVPGRAPEPHPARAPEPRPVSAHAAEPRPVSAHAAEPRPVSGRAVEPRPVSGRAAEPRPVSGRAAERPTSVRAPEPESEPEPEPESESMGVEPEHAAFFGADARAVPPRSGRDPRRGPPSGSARGRASGRRPSERARAEDPGYDREAAAGHQEPPRRGRFESPASEPHEEYAAREVRPARDDRHERSPGRAPRRYERWRRGEPRESEPFLRRYWAPLVGIGGAVTVGLLAGLLYTQWTAHNPGPPPPPPSIGTAPPAPGVPTRSVSSGRPAVPLVRSTPPSPVKRVGSEPNDGRLPEVTLPGQRAQPSLLGPAAQLAPVPAGTLPGALPVFAPVQPSPSAPAPAGQPAPAAPTAQPAPQAPAVQPAPPPLAPPPAAVAATRPTSEPAAPSSAGTPSPQADKPPTAAPEKTAAAADKPPEKSADKPPEKSADESDEPNTDPYHRLR